MRKVLFILSELEDGDLDWMIRHGSKEVRPRGSVLIREGEPISVLYIVLDGTLSVSLRALGGAEVAQLRSGEVLGELSFLDSRPPSASVTAATDATVLSVPRELLAKKLEDDPPFAARFYRALAVFLATRLRRTQQRLGYGGKSEILDEDVAHEDEIQPELLETVGLASARFDWMLGRLRSAPAHVQGGTSGSGAGPGRGGSPT
jgi:bacteriocin-type transport-associated protein